MSYDMRYLVKMRRVNTEKVTGEDKPFRQSKRTYFSSER